MNTANNFTFKGRYTLRGINGTYYIYDRELMTTTEKAGNTFTKASTYLLKKYPEVKA